MTSSLTRDPSERADWLQSIPFFIVHLIPLAAFWTGVRPLDIALCVGLYLARMFFITAGYHRYFSHRSYKMGRFMQFLMAFGGATAAQKGPLWWAAVHRHHHKFSDTAADVHSPRKGFWWSQVGWILCSKYKATDVDAVKDLAKFPELRWLDRHYLVPPVLLGVACFLIGGWSALVIGFFLSTVITWHFTFFINSLAHVIGRPRYATGDDSKNSLVLALLTLGEGWHNNHHYYQSSANQGFFFWEIDVSFAILRLLEKLGLVRDLRRPPARVLEAGPKPEPDLACGMLPIAGWTTPNSSNK